MKNPVQIGHPFKRGECVFPVVRGYLSQTVVKARYDDGSCKHAIFNFIFDSVSGERKPLEIVQGTAPTTSAGMTLAQMAAMLPPVAVEFWNANFSQLLTTQTLQELMLPAHITTHLSGPIATDIEVTDKTEAHHIRFNGSTAQYDPAGNACIKLVWNLTFYPTVNKIRMRLRIENSNIRALQETVYATRVLVDGVKVAEHPWDIHSRNRVWRPFRIPGETMGEYWIGGAPAQLSINPNLKHIASTKAFPNYDTSFQVSPTAITAMLTKYASARRSWMRNVRDLSNCGFWNTAMSAAGTRADFGPAMAWVIMWLYSGNRNLFNLCVEESIRFSIQD